MTDRRAAPWLMIGLLLLSVAPGRAQPMRLRLTFEPGAETGTPLTASAGYVPTPDQRLIAIGFYSPFYLNGTRSPHGIARLLADGSLDATFDAQLAEGETVRAAVVAPDGRVLVATNIPTYMDSGLGRIVRLLANGTVDASFAPLDIYGGAIDLALAGDGSLMAWGEFSLVHLSPPASARTNALVHISASGAIDWNFAPNLPSLRAVTSLAISGDRVVFTAVSSSPEGSDVYYFDRLTHEGALDPSFSPAATDGAFRILAALDSDRLLISNGTLRRLNSSGAVDPTFAPQIPEVHAIDRAVPLPGGRIAVEAATGSYDVGAVKSVFILQASGALERDCRLLPGGERIQALCSVLSDGRVALAQGPLVREPIPPYLTSYAPGIAEPRLCLVDDGAGTLAVLPTTIDSVSAPGRIDRLSSDAGGRVLVAGNFTYIAGAPRAGYARFNVDGTLDPAFVPVAANPLFHLPDGRIIASQTALGPADADGFHPYVTRVVRLNAEGSVDPTFVASPNFDLLHAQWLAASPDGRILAFVFEGGVAVDGNARLVWLDPTGQTSRLSTTFAGLLPYPAPPQTALNNAVPDAAILSDGKLLLTVLNRATTINGAPAPILVRLNSDGSTDTSYRPSTHSLSTVINARPLPDGRAYVFGAAAPGSLSAVLPDPALRLNADGSPDTFVASAFAWSTRMSDGFYYYSLSDLQRFYAEGTRDLNFSTPSLPGGSFSATAAIAADGSLWILGSIPRYRDQPRVVLGRFVPDEVYAFTVQPASQTVTAGQDITFQAEFGAVSGVTFQWTHDGTAIPGATGRRLPLAFASAADAGEYRLVARFGGNTYTSDAVTLTVATNQARLTNFSARCAVSPDYPPQIGGFVLHGPRTVLLRAVGRGLPIDNPGFTLLPRPVLRLYQGSTAGAEDAGGALAPAITAVGQRVGAVPLRAEFPASEPTHDSALLLALPAGVYTAHVTSGDRQTGVSLFEFYDAETDSDSPAILNVSVRGRAAAGDDVLISGFVVAGPGKLRLLIRGIGPALVPLGVGDALENPQLTLFKKDTVIATNDDWTDQPDSSIIADVARHVGAFALPAGSRDAAILITLDPGVYTVHGAGSTPGEMMIELYVVEN